MDQGRTKKRLLVGIVAAVLMIGCSSTVSGVPPTVPETSILDQMEQEALSKELEEQLLAILNLGRPEDEQVVSDEERKAIADFYTEAALEDPQTYPADGQYRNVNDKGYNEKNCYFLVYDGMLSSTKVGNAILASLKELDQMAALYYSKLQNLAVAYGQNEDRAVWVVVAYYQILT